MEKSECYLGMTDVFTRKKRSEVMSKIRSRGNRDTELALIKIFRRGKITGWRRHCPVFGRPDFVFPSRKTAVFVDGCFWHRCPKCRLKPKQNRAFWKKKLAANKARDRKVNDWLKAHGWLVVRIWECALNKEGFVLRKTSLRKSTP